MSAGRIASLEKAIRSLEALRQRVDQWDEETDAKFRKKETRLADIDGKISETREKLSDAKRNASGKENRDRSRFLSDRHSFTPRGRRHHLKAQGI